MTGIPSFDGIWGMYFYPQYNSKVDSKSDKCAHPECNQNASGECESKLCRHQFCSKHVTHMHMHCSVPGCINLGFSAAENDDYTMCENHYKSLGPDVIIQTRVRGRGAEKCRTCGKVCGSKSLGRGYCEYCDPMWMHLKAQGIKGPFG